jgi:hypothetical protein
MCVPLEETPHLAPLKTTVNGTIKHILALRFSLGYSKESE